MKEYIELSEKKKAEFDYLEALTKICEEIKITPPSSKTAVEKAPGSTNLVKKISQKFLIFFFIGFLL